MNIAKLIVALLGTVVIVVAALTFLPKKKEVPQGSPSCISNQQCERACVAMVDLQVKRVLSADRINQKEFDMIMDSAHNSCEYACETAKTK
jgi:Flp pilus assembly protein CpaB